MENSLVHALNSEGDEGCDGGSSRSRFATEGHACALYDLSGKNNLKSRDVMVGPSAN